MPAGELHNNDYGTIFKFNVLDQDSAIVDISSALVKQVMFQRPDATTFNRNMGLYTNGTDGIAVYTTTSGDINQVGSWQFQCFVVLPSGAYSSDITRFEVFENLYNTGFVQQYFLN